VSLADGDMVAEAGLHLDLVQLAVGPLQNQKPAARHQRLGLDLRVVQLEAQPLARPHVDELGGVGRIGRRQQNLIAPGFFQAPSVRLD